MDDLLERMTTPYLVPKIMNKASASGERVILFAFTQYNPKYGTKREQLERHCHEYLVRGDHFVPLKEDNNTATLLYLPWEVIQAYQERVQTVLYQLKMNVLFYETSLEGREALAESQMVLMRHPILIVGSQGFQDHLDAVTATFYRPKGSEKGFLERESLAAFVWARPGTTLEKIEKMVAFLDEQVKEYEKSRTRAAIQAWQDLKYKLDYLILTYG